MHCTHWLVSNAVRLTCGPQLKGTIEEFVLSLLLNQVESMNSAVYLKKKKKKKGDELQTLSEVVVTLVEITLQPHWYSGTSLSVPHRHHHRRQSHQDFRCDSLEMCFLRPVSQWKLPRKCWIWMKARAFAFRFSPELCHCMLVGGGGLDYCTPFEGGGFKQYVQMELIGSSPIICLLQRSSLILISLQFFIQQTRKHTDKVHFIMKESFAHKLVFN